MELTGGIIAGRFDEETNEFSLQQVKHFTTETTINEKQLKSLYRYLMENGDRMDGQVITLYDQLPVRLNQEEIRLLLEDLEQIKAMFEQ